MKISSLSSFNVIRYLATKTQLDVMVAPRAVAAEILKKREDLKSRHTGPLNNAHLQVLGSSAHGFSPSLIVNSEGRAYLFNCGEGVQRICNANKIKLINLENVFLTHANWSKIAGAYGLSLTLQDIGVPKLTINFSDSLTNFFTSARSFLNFYSGPEGRTRDIARDKCYEDQAIRIRCIAIETCDHFAEPKRTKWAANLLAYYCSLPDLPGPLDPQRCKDLKVPVGPKLGLLKSGKDVELDDGTVIKSTDVCGPKNRGSNFLIVDCPSVNHIQSFIESADLNEIRDRQGEIIDLVVHLSPADVTTDANYKEWMNGFQEDCKHILACNSEPPMPNFLDSYRFQYLLGQLDGEIFPSLNLPASIVDDRGAPTNSIIPNAADESEPKAIFKGFLKDQDKKIRASSFDKFTLRPNQIYESVEPIPSLDSVFEQAKLEVDFDEEYNRYKAATANLQGPLIHEPEVVFLGTGSALPSKLRNTSCILVNFSVPEKASVILDCGEDSHGQLVRFYGLEGSKEILKSLKMIYISHHHADHHIGLIEILRHRSLMADGPVLLLVPPGIETHLNYHNDEFEDLSKTYTIINTKLLQRNTGLLDKHKPELLHYLTIVDVDHCHNSCAAIFEFNIRRPGMNTFKLAYSGDARPSDEFALKGLNCDLLIHEATFDHRDSEAALEKKHSTTEEAIEVGKKMKAKFTILTHFSQRYPKIPYFTECFDDTVGFAFDNMAIRCPSQLKRIPLMKDLLRVVFAKSLAEIDDRYTKVSLKNQRKKRKRK